MRDGAACRVVGVIDHPGSARTSAFVATRFSSARELGLTFRRVPDPYKRMSSNPTNRAPFNVAQAQAVAGRLLLVAEASSAEWLAAESDWMSRPSDRGAWLRYERAERRLERLRRVDDWAQRRLRAARCNAADVSPPL